MLGDNPNGTRRTGLVEKDRNSTVENHKNALSGVAKVEISDLICKERGQMNNLRGGTTAPWI